MYNVYVKSGTGNYFDYDGCPKLLATIPSNNIPVIGNTLFFGDKENKNSQLYLVRSVETSIIHKSEKSDFKELISVYVIPS